MILRGTTLVIFRVKNSYRISLKKSLSAFFDITVKTRISLPLAFQEICSEVYILYLSTYQLSPNLTLFAVNIDIFLFVKAFSYNVVIIKRILVNVKSFLKKFRPYIKFYCLFRFYLRIPILSSLPLRINTPPTALSSI